MSSPQHEPEPELELEPDPESTSTSTSTPLVPPAEPLWRFRWILYAAGAALMAIGLRGIVIGGVLTRRANFTKFFVGSAAVHDVLVAPFVIAIGWLVVRTVPARARGVVQCALIVSGSLIAVAGPVLTGYGRRPNNTSALTQNYGRNLLILLAVVWLIAGLALWLRSRRPSRAPSRP